MGIVSTLFVVNVNTIIFVRRMKMPTFDIYVIDGKSLRVSNTNRLTEIVNETEKEYENGKVHKC